MADTTSNNSISQFINGFGGGLRPNRFRISGAFGGNDTTDDRFTYLVRAASMPGSDLSLISVPYRGRLYKIPGNRSYIPWQMVVLDDRKTTTGSLWKKFQDWSSLINSHKANQTNDPTTGGGNFTNYMKDYTVTQLDINGKCERQIQLISCWPSEVGSIDFSMADNENYVTFTVTLEYQYFVRVANPVNCDSVG
jgi:hypothetical protein